MAYNKVVYGSDVLIDLTADTVTAGTMVKNTTAHAADGSAVTGTLKRAYSFAQTNGYYSIFCLPISGGSVTSEVWTPGNIGTSVSGTALTIGG